MKIKIDETAITYRVLLKTGVTDEFMADSIGADGDYFYFLKDRVEVSRYHKDEIVIVATPGFRLEYD